MECARRSRQKLRLAVLFAAISACPMVFAEAGISDWLMRVEMAPDNVNYIGSFIYEHDGKMETMRVAHRAEDDGFRQRLFALTGSAREVIRDAESVWCFLPDQKIGVHEYRKSSRNSFLQIRGEQIAELEAFYDFKLGAVERIADRPARVIHVMPRDGYRYGYGMWVDTESALLLRTDLLDEQARTVERYMFVEISIGTEIGDDELQPRTSKESLSWFGIDKPESDADADDAPMHWDSSALPPGFELSYSINRREPMADGLVEHHVYSDGLSSVSMFVKRIDDEKVKVGFSRMGAVSAYVREIDEFVVTVIGEVPEKTVQMIADGVERNP
ncbi:MAG: hypothetical protein DWQ08_14915 [Proteobacteria bacterium]|nr:MAG: hypothetical protein DWQ08_14915 [Pseudomonadota bacterium]